MLRRLLHTAAMLGDIEQLDRVLLQAGSAASLRALLQDADENGRCAMVIAIHAGMPDAAVWLLTAERETVRLIEQREEIDAQALRNELTLSEFQTGHALRRLSTPSRIVVPPVDYTCHTCMRVGHHYHSQCPMHVCARCGGKGHVLRACPTVNFVPADPDYACIHCGASQKHFAQLCPLLRGSEDDFELITSVSVKQLRPILQTTFDAFPSEWAAVAQVIGTTVDGALVAFNRKYVQLASDTSSRPAQTNAKTAVLDKIRKASGVAVITALVDVQHDEAMACLTETARDARRR